MQVSARSHVDRNKARHATITPEVQKIVNSQRIVDLIQAIQACYKRKHGLVALGFQEFDAETEEIACIRYTVRKEDRSFLLFAGRGAYAEQHFYLEVHVL